MTMTPSTTLVFLLDNLPDRECLAENLPADTTVVYLDSRTNALARMAGYLAMLPAGSVGAIHLVSHGSSGSLSLGSLTLDNGNLHDHAVTLAKIGEALTADGDLLLYGCNVASGEAGQAFIAALAEATGADVAASDDLTGNTAQGGDSVLEAFTGSIENAALKLDAMAGVLPESVIRGTEGSDIFFGKGGDDILHGLGGNDYLTCNDGNDTLYGGDGNDDLCGGGAMTPSTAAMALTPSTATMGMTGFTAAPATMASIAVREMTTSSAKRGMTSSRNRRATTSSSVALARI